MIEQIPLYESGKTVITARAMNALVKESRRVGQFSTNGRIDSIDDAAGRNITVPPAKKDRVPIIAKITGGGAGGLYEATQQKWNPVTVAFEDEPINPKEWGASLTTFPSLREENGSTAVPVDAIVKTYLISDDAGELERTFSFTAAGAATIFLHPFRGEIDPADDTKIVVGRLRADAGYKFRDTITVGLLQLHKNVAEAIVITEDSWVFYAITIPVTTIVATLSVNAVASYPTQVDGTWNVVLGRADFSGGAIIRWTQHRFEDIDMPARFG